MQYRRYGLLEQYLLLKIVGNRHFTRYRVRIELRKRNISLSISEFYRLINCAILKGYVKMDEYFTCAITDKGMKRMMELERFIKECLL